MEVHLVEMLLPVDIEPRDTLVVTHQFSVCRAVRLEPILGFGERLALAQRALKAVDWTAPNVRRDVVPGVLHRSDSKLLDGRCQGPVQHATAAQLTVILCVVVRCEEVSL